MNTLNTILQLTSALIFSGVIVYLRYHLYRVTKENIEFKKKLVTEFEANVVLLKELEATLVSNIQLADSNVKLADLAQKWINYSQELVAFTKQTTYNQPIN